MIIRAVIALILLVSGFLAGWRLADPGVVEVKTTEVRYNTVERDISAVPLQELQRELLCYWNAFPLLDIRHESGNLYTLSAGLCERNWSKKAYIRPRDSPRNMIIAGPSIDSRFNPGAQLKYYRIFSGRVGLGGGAGINQEYVQISGGLLFMW
jgi:hypothetical protein